MEIRKRINISNVISGIYLLTVLLVSTFPFKSWESIGFGLILASFGTTTTFLLLKQWEVGLKRLKIPYHVSEPTPLIQNDPIRSNKMFEELEFTLTESQNRQKGLIEELNAKDEALHKIETEKARFEHQMEDVYHKLHISKTEADEEIRRKTVLLSEYQETINQQRDVIKKKQDQITELESKVRDLNYEVKTLLQLAELGNKNGNLPKLKQMEFSETINAYQVDMFEEESGARPQNITIKTPEEASLQLKRCVDIAQKITGSSRFNNGNSRFRDLPIDNRALDLRRLFDNLRSENSGTVIVYSQKEDKLLFANNQTANLLGWSPEKFTKNFPEIIAEGNEDWKKGISALSSHAESKVRLVMKTKSGQNLLVHCHLGMIPTGAFRHHVIGVLYSA